MNAVISAMMAAVKLGSARALLNCEGEAAVPVMTSARMVAATAAGCGAECGWVWPAVAGCGRMWPGVAGCGRMWPCYPQCMEGGSVVWNCCSITMMPMAVWKTGVGGTACQALAMPCWAEVLTLWASDDQPLVSTAPIHKIAADACSAVATQQAQGGAQWQVVVAQRGRVGFVQ